jgi:transposase-like protein
VRILECPHCHGSDLYYEAGLITGYKYHCKSCDYVGAFVIEREIEVPKE